MMKLDTLNTDRMIARAPCEKDFNDLYPMFSNIEFIKIFGVALSKDKLKTTFEKDIEQWKTHSYGSWIFRNKVNDTFIGLCGLNHKIINGQNEIALDYALLPKYWRQGYGFEMAQACLKIGFESLHLQNIACLTLDSNIASKRLMEKLGFKYEKNITDANLSYLLYRLPQSDD